MHSSPTPTPTSIGRPHIKQDVPACSSTFEEDEEREYYRKKIVEVYEEKNPEKIQQVDRIMNNKTYKGNWEACYQDVCKKYIDSPLGDDASSSRVNKVHIGRQSVLPEGISVCWWYWERAGQAIPVVSMNGEHWSTHLMSAANEVLNNKGGRWKDACELIECKLPFLNVPSTIYRSTSCANLYFGGAGHNTRVRDLASALAALVASSENSMQMWWPEDLRSAVNHLRTVHESRGDAVSEDFKREHVELKEKLDVSEKRCVELIDQLAEEKRCAELIDEVKSVELEKTKKQVAELSQELEKKKEELEKKKGHLWKADFEEAKTLIALDRAHMRGIRNCSQQLPFNMLNCLSAQGSSVFIGNHSVARDMAFLQNKRIKRILNVSSREYSEMAGKYTAGGIEVLHLKLDDEPWEDILSQLEQAHYFLDSAEWKGEHVLVHCTEGRNRSAAVLVSYLMKSIAQKKKNPWKHQMDALNLFWEALSKVNEERSGILTQASFRFQLVLWAICRCDSETATRHRLFNALRCHCCIMAKVRELSVDVAGVSEDVIYRYADRITAKEAARKGGGIMRSHLNKHRDGVLNYVSRSVSMYLAAKDSAYSSSSDGNFSE